MVFNASFLVPKALIAVPTSLLKAIAEKFGGTVIYVYVSDEKLDEIDNK